MIPEAPAGRRHVGAVVALALLAMAGSSRAGPAFAESRADARPRAEALAFVRVVADVRVDFGGVREPIEERDVELATGSGFVAGPAGLVVTSAHVVAEKDDEVIRHRPDGRARIENRRIEVVVGGGTSRRSFEAWVAAIDDELDLAALQVTAADLPYLPMGDSDAVEPGRPVQVLGFPFGRQVEVARGGDAMPNVTVTAGSLSAAREGEGGDRRFLQTDASVNPGSSGGPMLDEDGYVVGVVRMKLSPGPTSAGAGFAVTVNLVKDFLEAHGLLAQLPVGRLRPGVPQAHDWKRVRLEAPDGFTDTAPTRVRLDLGEIEGVDARVYRLPTGLPPEELADALLRRGEVPGFVPAPAGPRPGGSAGRRAGATLTLASAEGETKDQEPFRVEYAILAWKDEKIVARYLGHPDAIAFNLGLVQSSLRSLDGAALRAALPSSPVARSWTSASFTVAAFPSGDATLPMPGDWVVEPAEDAAWPACVAGAPVGGGLAARHPADPAVVLRAWRLGPRRHEVERASGAGCGASRRFSRLGIVYDVRDAIVRRAGESLLLELEAPADAWPLLDGALEHWVEAVKPAAPLGR